MTRDEVIALSPYVETAVKAYEAALREWHFSPTISNASWRDVAREELYQQIGVHFAGEVWGAPSQPHDVSVTGL